MTDNDPEDHLRRVRRICMALPGTTEKLSHGEPIFLVRKRAYTMFANNHHHDGRIAVWIPAAPGAQVMMTHAAPDTYFKPPYVGGAGWIGVALGRIGDDELAGHIREAWQLILRKK